MNEGAHEICQQRFPAQEIIVPVGGYCYIRDVGGVCTKEMCEETSVVTGAEPTSQLEPRHDRGWGGVLGLLRST